MPATEPDHVLHIDLCECPCHDEGAHIHHDVPCCCPHRHVVPLDCPRCQEAEEHAA